MSLFNFIRFCSISYSSFIILILLLLFHYINPSSKVYSEPNSFHSEYCGSNSFNNGPHTITCTFSAPQSDLLRHTIALAQVGKPPGFDISFNANYLLSAFYPYTSMDIAISVGTSSTIKLGFFAILIKIQSTTKYIDFIQMGINTPSNLSDSSGTVRSHYQDKDLAVLNIMSSVSANNLMIVPFVTHFSYYLNNPLVNNPTSQYDFTFKFDSSVLSSTVIRMTVAIQPFVSMNSFYGCFLLVNNPLIQSQKAAYLSNPTLTATDAIFQRYYIGDPMTGKIATANFQTLYSSFGPSFNTKCFLGFDQITYTQLTQFSFQLGKNTYNNFNTYSQTTSTTKNPSIRTNFFCYGLGVQCADFNPVYDITSATCYTQATCPLAFPGGWTYPSLCPWCNQLICQFCSVSNRQECNTCSPGSNSVLNPTTKQCECVTGYYEVYKDISPNNWNGQTQSLFQCLFNCTHMTAFCKIDQCTTTTCTACQDGYLLITDPLFGTVSCPSCTNYRANCAKCSSTDYCDVCMDGYFIYDLKDSATPFPNTIGRACDACLLNCKTCPGSTSCDVCFSEYILNGPKTSCTCDAILANLLNCQTCTVATTCDTCNVGYYVSPTTGKCQPCSNINSQCIECSDINTCTKCNSGYGLDITVIPSKTVCSICNKNIPNCDSCDTIDSCNHCVAPYGIANPTICQYCQILKVPGCIQCLNAVADCTKCNSLSYLINGTCFFCQDYISKCISCTLNPVIKQLQCIQCQVGYYLHLNLNTNKKECLPCSQAINKCLQCQSQTFCVKCQFPNLISPDNLCGLCEPAYVNYDGFCMKEPGCLSVYQTFPGVQTCLACRDYLHYVYQSTAQICVCDKGYSQVLGLNVSEQKCVNVCGDGLLISAFEQCDDNNLINYDGCGMDCKKEANFQCTLTSPSICVLYRDFSRFELIFTQRIQAQHKGILHFKIQPIQPGLYTADWKNLLTLNLSQQSVKKSSFTYRYQRLTGQLQIQFEYLQTLQDKYLQYQLIFDPTKIVSSISYFKQVKKIQGINAPLILQDTSLLQNSKILSFICFILSMLALIQFYIGSYLNKMIGLQTIQIFQLIYFIRMNITINNTTIVDSLNQLKYTAQGYSNYQVFYGNTDSSINQYIPHKLYQIGIFRYFLMNVNFWICLIILTILAYLIVSIRKCMDLNKMQKNQQPGAKQKYVLTRRSLKWLYDHMIFPQVMMLSMVTYFTSLLYFKQQQHEIKDKINLIQILSFSFLAASQFSVFAIFAFQILICLKQYINSVLKISLLLSPMQKLQLDENSTDKANFHSCYILFYLIYYFLLSLIISLNIEISQFNYSLQMALVVSVIYFGIIFYWSPYYKSVKVHNYFLFFNHAVSIIGLVIFEFFHRKANLKPITYIGLLYFLISLLFLVLSGGFVRLYFQYQFRKRLFLRGKNKQIKFITGEQNEKILSKKQRLNQMFENNGFTFKNQLQQLKYSKKISFVNIQTKNNIKNEEELLISKMRQQIYQKNIIYQDFWGKSQDNQNNLISQLLKPQEVKPTDKGQQQIDNNKDNKQKQDQQKVQYKNEAKGKSKYSNRQKQHLRMLKYKLRQQLNYLNQDQF